MVKRVGARALPACPLHLRHPAPHRDVPDAGVRLDKGESHRGSLAKKAVAFLRISRCSRSRSLSMLIRRTCSLSESTSPSPSPLLLGQRAESPADRSCADVQLRTQLRDRARRMTREPDDIAAKVLTELPRSGLAHLTPRFESPSKRLRCPLNRGSSNSVHQPRRRSTYYFRAISNVLSPYSAPTK
jgi:hypothetical protein